MPNRDIIVMGASAGGIESLVKIFQALPESFPASIFVVVHISPNAVSTLPALFSRKCRLKVVHPKDGDPILRGMIYIAPPDKHLLVGRDHIHVSSGPKENRSRPSIDVLFRSASKSFGPRVIGVVLSGMLDDGSGGVVTIKRRDGVVIVQDPSEALFREMPKNAIEATQADYVIRTDEIAELLPTLIRQEVLDVGEKPTNQNNAPTLREMGRGNEDPPTPFRCPECGGALWEREEGNVMQYVCHVGHAYSPNSLMSDSSEEIEAALWTALRILQERIAICRRLSQRCESRGLASSQRFAEEATVAEARAGVLRRLLEKEPYLAAQEA